MRSPERGQEGLDKSPLASSHQLWKHFAPRRSNSSFDACCPSRDSGEKRGMFPDALSTVSTACLDSRSFNTHTRIEPYPFAKTC